MLLKGLGFALAEDQVVCGGVVCAEAQALVPKPGV